MLVWKSANDRAEHGSLLFNYIITEDIIRPLQLALHNIDNM